MLDLFRVAKGIQLESADFSSEVSVLFGSGVPGGDNGDQDNAPIGSIYLRTDAGPNGHQVYYKFSSGSPSSPDDWRVLASQEYVDAIALGLSWREPVRVIDSTLYANVAAAQAAYNSASPQFVVDGVEVVDGDRVLLTNLTSGNENVYNVNIAGSPQVLTLVEDGNVATDGDALLVQDGTYAETQWVFDGANWIQFSSAGDATELQNIRNFIGKNAPGVEFPVYTSTDVVTQNANLETAIGELDAVVGDVYEQGAVVKTNNVTSLTVVDTLPVAQAQWAKWLITIVEVGNPSHRRSGELDAITDGTTVDYNDFGRLKLGSVITGLSYAVQLAGSPGSLQLVVSSTPAVNVTVKRLGFGTF